MFCNRGVASQIFMPDYHNWTNAQFDSVRMAKHAHGFLNTTSSAEADYNTTVNSWIEQRLYVTGAVKVKRPPFGMLLNAPCSHTPACQAHCAPIRLYTYEPFSAHGCSIDTRVLSIYRHCRKPNLVHAPMTAWQWLPHPHHHPTKQACRVPAYVQTVPDRCHVSLV